MQKAYLFLWVFTAQVFTVSVIQCSQGRIDTSFNHAARTLTFEEDDNVVGQQDDNRRRFQDGHEFRHPEGTPATPAQLKVNPRVSCYPVSEPFGLVPTEVDSSVKKYSRQDLECMSLSRLSSLYAFFKNIAGEGCKNNSYMPLGFVEDLDIFTIIRSDQEVAELCAESFAAPLDQRTPIGSVLGNTPYSPNNRPGTALDFSGVVSPDALEPRTLATECARRSQVQTQPRLLSPAGNDLINEIVRLQDAMGDQGLRLGVDVLECSDKASKAFEAATRKEDPCIPGWQLVEANENGLVFQPDVLGAPQQVRPYEADTVEEREVQVARVKCLLKNRKWSSYPEWCALPAGKLPAKPTLPCVDVTARWGKKEIARDEKVKRDIFFREFINGFDDVSDVEFERYFEWFVQDRGYTSTQAKQIKRIIKNDWNVNKNKALAQQLI